MKELCLYIMIISNLRTKWIECFYNKPNSLADRCWDFSPCLWSYTHSLSRFLQFKLWTKQQLNGYHAQQFSELILVLLQVGRLLKIATALPIFLIYSEFEWFYSLSFIIALRYMQATVYKAFLSVPDVYCHGSHRSVVKKTCLEWDALMGVLIGVIIASVVNMFLRSSGSGICIPEYYLPAGLTAKRFAMIKQWSTCYRLGSAMALNFI